MSAAARKKIAAAQRERWAKWREKRAAKRAQVIIIETKYVKVHTVREAAEQVARSVL